MGRKSTMKLWMGLALLLVLGAVILSCGKIGGTAPGAVFSSFYPKLTEN